MALDAVLVLWWKIMQNEVYICMGGRIEEVEGENWRRVWGGVEKGSIERNKIPRQINRVVSRCRPHNQLEKRLMTHQP